MPPVRVLIIAADPLARNALAAMLRAEEGLAVVGQAAADDNLAETSAIYRPDVLLWETGWEGADGLQELADAGDDLPPILAIAAADASARLWAAGVRGVVERTADAATLAAALAAVAQGLGVFVAPPGDDDSWRPPIRAGGAPSPLVEALTPREMDVLGAMADGLSNKLIARKLSISEHTVKYHVNAILGKLDAQSRTDAVVRATRAGILLL